MRIGVGRMVRIYCVGRLKTRKHCDDAWLSIIRTSLIFPPNSVTQKFALQNRKVLLFSCRSFSWSIIRHRRCRKVEQYFFFTKWRRVNNTLAHQSTEGACSKAHPARHKKNTHYATSGSAIISSNCVPCVRFNFKKKPLITDQGFIIGWRDYWCLVGR